VVDVSEFASQIAAATRAVEIRSPTRFAWLGEPSPSLPRVLRLDPVQKRAFLLSTLGDRLYANFYCRGRPELIADRGHRNDLRGDPKFVACLSGANSGRGCWELGWNLLARHPGWSEVGRDGLRLEAASDECRQGPGGLAVRFPKEFLAMAPGFYTALTDRPVDSGPVVRLYWNVGPEGAVPFVREATASLNAARIGARLKVVSHPWGFDRCDAAVLYVAGCDLPVASAVVRTLHSVLAPYLEPEVPALTLRVAPGVALAEDPGEGSSFGQHRCRLIAEGLIRANEEGGASVEERVSAVLETLSAGGVEPAAPYLNAGSVIASQVAELSV
jgi:hypothetical protein